MKFVLVLSTVALVLGVAAAPASAMPREAPDVAITAADVGQPRIVCNSRRCGQAGGFRYYRPYGYYRPYYDAPRHGPGTDPFGVHIF